MKTTDKNQPEILINYPQRLIELAIEKGSDISQLEKLLDLQLKWEASRSRMLFYEAITKFQSELNVITKNKTVDFTTKSGFRVKYNYSTLDSIIEQIKNPMSENGLSYRWEFSDAETIAVRCVITHVSGHSEATTMKAASDNSGNKNDIQSKGSTLTYLQRYTLLGALGIGTAESDVDGHSQEQPVSEIKIDSIDDITDISINDIKSMEELELFWKSNNGLHKNTAFKAAINKRKLQISKNK